MKFSKNDDVILILNLTDRRGKRIRVNMVNDIKVRIWTQDPNKFIGKGKRDIIQKPEYDMIVLTDYEMSSLPSGVIQYEYKYNTFSHDFDDKDKKYDRSNIVVTDLYWKNKNISEHPSNPINYESLEALKDMLDREHNERIKQFKDLQHYVSEVYTNALQDEVERATYREDEIEDKINSSNSKMDKIESKLNEEIERANSSDIALFKYIKEVEQKSGANSEEQDKKNEEIEKEIDTTKEDLTKLVEEEKERAIKAETDLDAKLDKNISKVKNKLTEINTSIDSEITRAKGEEARIEGRMEAEKARAKEAEKHLQNDIDDEIKRAKLKEEELYKLITENTDKDGTLKERVYNVEKGLDSTNIALENEINRATTNEDRLEEMIKNNSNLIQNENSRAELVEKDLAESLQKLKQNQLDNNSNVNSTLEELRNELAQEAIARENEDERINNILDTLNGSEDVVGSIDHKIADSFHSVEHLIDQLRDSLSDFIGTSLDDYATKAEVEERIKHLIGTAPENLDTLEEIAERLQRDDDLFKAIQEILSGKASKEDVYTKAEIDRKEADLNNLIQNEEQRATLAESGLQGQLDTLNGDYADFKEKVNKHIQEGDSNYNEVSNLIQQEINRAKAEEEAINNSLTYTKNDLTSLTDKVNSHINDADSKVQELNNSIVAEQTRATNIETQLQNQLDVINGDSSVVGSTDHKIDDLRHELEDKITEVENNFVNTTLSDYALKADVYNRNEIDSKVEEINNSIVAESNRAKNEEQVLTNNITNVSNDLESLTEKVNKHIADGDANYQEVYNAIVKEETRATNEETKLQNQIDVLNGDSSVVGSVEHKIDDLRHELQESVNSTMGNYYTKEETDSKISNVKSEIIGGAGADYDTLKDIQNWVEEHQDLYQALISTVGEKANASDVYTKNEINSKVEEINNTIVTERNRATQEESKLQAAIDIINGDEEQIGSIKHSEKDANHYTDDEISKLKLEYNETLKGYADLTKLQEIIDNFNSHVQDYTQSLAQVNNDILAETQRAINVETNIQNSLDTINGDENTIGSINHALADGKHYTDDEIAKLKAENSTIYSTKEEVENVKSNLENKIDENKNWVEQNYCTKEYTTEYVESTKLSLIEMINGLIERVERLEKIVDWNNF